MSTQVQWKRGSTAENNGFTGAVGEITVDTTLKQLRVHDGVTPGGVTIAGTTVASNSATNLVGGTAGQIPYQTGPNATTFFGPGSAGSVLVSYGASGTPTFQNTLTLAGTTQATSTLTGALVVAGGVGVGGNLYVGGDIVATKLIIQYTTVTTTSVTTDDVFTTYNTTPTSSSSTGALVIAGGAGFGGSGYFGGVVTATNFFVNGYAVSTASALTIQGAGVGLGTAGTLNFGTGTFATVANNLATIWLNTTTLMASAVTAFNLANGTAGQLAYQSGAGSTAFINTATTGNFLQANYAGVPTWTTTASMYVGNSVVTNKIAGGTDGQLVYQVSPGVTGFAGPGTAGQILLSNGTSGPVYTNTSSIYVQDANVSTNLRAGAAGSLPYQTGADATAFLGIGTNGYVLTSNGTAPTWTALGGLSAGLATTATNLAGGAYGSIPVQLGTGTTGFIAAGTQGQMFVQGVGQGYWENTSSIYVANSNISTNVRSGTAGQIVYQSASDTTAFINTATTGNFLQANYTGSPTWTTTASMYVNSAVQAETLKGGGNGSLLYQSANNTTSFLNTGTPGQLLVAGVGLPAFTNTTTIQVGYSANVLGGTAGQLHYQSNPNTTAFVNTATTGNFLQANYIGAPTWTTTANMYVQDATVSTNVRSGTAGQLVYQSAGSTTGFINTATTGNFLQANYAGAPTWTTTASMYVNSAVQAETIKGGTAGQFLYQSAPNTTAFINTGSMKVGYSINLIGGAAGSLPYQTAGDTTGFLSIGTNGYVLTSNGTSPTWSALSGLSAGLATTATNLANGTAGQLPYQSGAGATAFINTATTGNFLQANYTGAPTWTTTASMYVANAVVATNVRAGTAGQLHYQSAADTTGFINTATTGNFLQANYAGVPTWTTTASMYVGNATISTNVRGGTTGQLVYQSATDATGFVGPGTAGQLLVSAGASAPVYTNTSSIQVGYAANLLGGTAGQFPYQSAGNTTAFISTGSMYVGNASKVDTILQTAAATYYPVFVDANNVAAAAESVYSTSSFNINPGTGLINATSLAINGTSADTGTKTSNALYVAGGAWIDKTLLVAGDTTFRGNVIFQGTNTFVYSSSTVYTDNLISLHAPSGSTPGSHTWTVDDGKDIGFMFHYYKTTDKDAFLGFANDTGYLEWYSDGTESGGVFTGTQYGTFKTGNVILAGGTNATNTTSGSLQITNGGAGIGGSVFIGGNLTVLGTINATINGTITTATNLAAGTAGQLVYQTGVGTTGFAGPGTAGQFLQSNGTSAPSYISTSSMYVGNAAKLDTVMQTAAGTYNLTFVDSNNATAASELHYTTSSFTINPATGQVGLGYISTSSRLTVNGRVESMTDLAGEGGQFVLRGKTWYRWSIDNYQDTFRIIREDDVTEANGQSALIISSGTNSAVMLGTTTPYSGERLAVNGGGYFNGIVTATTFVGNLTGTASKATNIAGGTAGQLHYQSGADTTGFVGPGTAGQILVSAGTSAPVYTNTGSIYVGNSNKVDTIAQVTSATYYPAFVDSNNAAAGSESVYTTSSFSVNPATGWVTASVFAATNNANGTNFKVGDDAWIGDVNTADTFRVMGQQSAANGYIIFGNNDTTALGRAGAGSLTYGGNVIVHGGNTSTTYVGRAVIADSASGGSAQVNVAAQTASGTYYPTFVDSNNASAGAESVYSTSSFTINPASGLVTVASGFTVAKNGTDSIITFPAQTNDPGYIKHYESSNAAAMQFSVSDDNGATDYFGFGSSSAMDTFKIFSNGTVAAGTWQGSSISTTYTDAKITSISTGTGLYGNATTGAVTLSLNTSTYMASAALATRATNLAGGAAWQIPYQSAADTTAFANSGTTGQFWQAATNGAPTWTSTANIYVNSAVNAEKLYGGSAMALVYQSAANTTAFLAAGTAGYLLQTNGTGSAPTWVAASGLSVTSASQVNTQQASTLAGQLYPTFVDSNNASATAETVYTTSSFYINPLSGATTIGGAYNVSDLAGVSNTPLSLISHTTGKNQRLDITHYRETAGTDTTGTYLQVGRYGGVGGSPTLQGFMRLRDSSAVLHSVAKHPVAFGPDASSSDMVGIDYYGRLHVGINVGGSTPTRTLNITASTPTLGFIDGSSGISASAKHAYLSASGGNLAWYADVYNQTAGGITFAVDNSTTAVQINAASTAPGGTSNGSLVVTGGMGVSLGANFGGVVTATNFSGSLSGGSAMALVYQSAANTTAYLAAGTSGYVLQTNGTGSAPSWVAASGLGAGSVANSVTFNSSGSGDASGTTYNGSAARTISYNTLGAAASNQTMYIGTTAVAINRSSASLSLTGVNIDGSAGSATNASNLSTIMQTASANYYLTFVDSNNSSAAYEAYYTTSSFVVNPATGNVGVGVGSGTLTNKFEVRGTAGQLFSVNDSFTGTIFSANDVSGIPSIEVLDTGLVKLAQYNGQVAINTSTAQTNMGLTVNSSTYLMSLGVGTVASGTTGEIRATNEITAYYSDRRLKENVKVIDNAVTKVLSLNGITYTPNDLAASFGYDKTVKLVGLFADEVEAILPEATRPAPFDQDENGNSKSGENYKTIQYEKLVPLLIEAVKEQQTTIDTLKAELESIKNLIAKGN